MLQHRKWSTLPWVMHPESAREQSKINKDRVSVLGRGDGYDSATTAPSGGRLNPVRYRLEAYYRFGGGHAPSPRPVLERNFAQRGAS